MLLDGVKEYFYTSIVQGVEPDITERMIEQLQPIMHKLIVDDRMNIVGVVTDNARNVTNAANAIAKEYGLFHMGCVAHQIQLIVHTFLKLEEVEPVKKTARKLIKLFLSNKHLRFRLHHRTRLCILGYSNVRWNSELRAFFRLLHLQKHIEYALHGNDVLSEVHGVMSKNLSSVCEVLKFFESKTNQIQKSKSNLFNAYLTYRHIQSQLRAFDGEHSFRGTILEPVVFQEVLGPV
jgi:hypothetical protein